MKTINLKVLLILLSLSMIGITSCKKYEDGPLISFRSRSERIANNWRVVKATENGNEVTGDFDRYEITFTKGGDANLTAHYTFLGIEYDYTTQGKWSFTDNDKKLDVNYDNDVADAVYVILKLEEKELWVRQENSNLELHLEPR